MGRTGGYSSRESESVVIALFVRLGIKWRAEMEQMGDRRRSSITLRGILVVSNACFEYNLAMPPKQPATSTLMVRKVDPAIKERLRVRAARNGRSMEAELRQILGDALAEDESREPNLAEAIRRRFAPFGGVELERHPPVAVRKPSSFD